METNLMDMSAYFGLRNQLKEGGSVVLEEPIRLKNGAVYFNSGLELNFSKLQRLKTMISKLEDTIICYSLK